MTTTNWFGGRSFGKTNLRMLEDERLCDVTFLAGVKQEQVRAHRFMLASRSEVFYSMFCGPMPESQEKIEIPDVEADILKELLRFIYCQECKVTGETVMTLMYAAKKYLVPELLNVCNEYLKENMSAENVCTILQQAHTFDEVELFKCALSHLILNAEEVFDSLEICSLSREVLVKVIQDDALSIAEEKIYRTCIRWAQHQCALLDRQPEPGTIREILGDVIYLIRFPVMDAAMFAAISEEELLSDSEKVNVFQQIIPHDSVIPSVSIFSLEPRLTKTSVFIQRFESFNSMHQIWQHSGKQDAISFSCSDSVLITGVSLFLPCNMGVLEGDLELCRDDEKLMTKRIRLEYRPDTFFQSVMFDKHVFLKKGEMYSLIQALRGSQTYRGQFGKAVIEDQGIVVTFCNNDRSMNGTKVTHGQFYGLFLKY